VPPGGAEPGALGAPDAGVIRLHMRDSATAATIGKITFFTSGHEPVDIQALDDISGNSRPEVALLVERGSDGQAVVRLHDAFDGTKVGKLEFLSDEFRARCLVVLPDLDMDGIIELGVFATRDSDGRALIEIRDADGSGSFRRIWFLSAGFEALGLKAGPDVDANGIVELAVLGRRQSDGRFVIERKNAQGPVNRTRMWFFGGGFEAVDFDVLPDIDGDTIPEYAVLATRLSDDRPAVEVRNAIPPKNPNRRFYLDERFDPSSVTGFADTDGDAVPELGVLGFRRADQRIKLELKNARGPANTRHVWFSP
jgi:hypothetical protein